MLEFGEMRFFYLDPGLRNNVGHHANYCRYIVGELRARAIETLVFGFAGIDGEFRSEMDANPLFKVSTNASLNSDPLCGWLIDFDGFAHATFDDLRRLPEVQPSDVVYMVSATPAQLMAVALWLRNCPADRQPTIVAEVGKTGLVASNGQAGLTFAVPDTRQDPRAVLLRYVATCLSPIAARLHFITFDRTVSEALNLLVARPVLTLPLPYRAVTTLRKRGGVRPIVVAILGHQRENKGFRHLPEIAATLLRARPDVHLLIQNVAYGAPVAQQQLRELAANNDRLMLSEQPAGRTLWPKLLEQSDLILCPYSPEFYMVAFSAVASEALANGIPIVVPAGTTLEKLIEECGGPGTAFYKFEPKSIVAATERVLDQFDRYAAQAYDAATKWPERRGPARLVDDLLSLVSPASALT